MSRHRCHQQNSTRLGLAALNGKMNEVAKWSLDGTEVREQDESAARRLKLRREKAEITRLEAETNLYMKQQVTSPLFPRNTTGGWQNWSQNMQDPVRW